MKWQELKIILYKNRKIILLFPVLLAIIVSILTFNAKREYLSSGIVYTGLASGYSITTDENQNLDFFSVNNAFDNLISTIQSRETIEETALRLLALHLSIRKPSKSQLSAQSFSELQGMLSPEIRKEVNGITKEAIYNNLVEVKNSSLKNEITDILNAGEGTYSIQQIRENLHVARRNSSDMLELSYVSHDPAIARQTPTILIDVFIARYKRMKGKETINVVDWFDQQLNRAQVKLKSAEENLKRFGIENKIINYYEQTKFIAEAKEETVSAREQEKNRIAAARANKTDLENKIQVKKDVYGINEELTRKRKELSELQYRIANAEVLGSDKDKIPAYKLHAEQLKANIDKQLNELHQYNSDPSGVSRDALLNNWLDNNLQAQGGGSKLDVIESRLNTFDNIYRKYAPLGAVLKGLEREVDVAEKEYLSVLHGLNQAKLRRQNIEMTNNISTLDKPFFPLKPQPSKQLILVLLSYIVGLVLATSYAIARYLLDNSIKNSENAANLTGNEVLAVLPDFSLPDYPSDAGGIKANIFNQIMGALSLKWLVNKAISKSLRHINVYSHVPEEGAEEFAVEMANFMHTAGNRVGLFLPDAARETWEENASVELNVHYYSITKDFLFVENLGELVRGQFTEENYDYIINVFPPFKDHQIPVKVMENADANLMVIDAGRSWTPFDKYLTDLCKKAVERPVLVVLNRADIYQVESAEGYISKKNFMQKFITRNLIVPKSRKIAWENI